MKCQDTPIHISLWHRDFWLIAVGNMFLTMSAYMLLPFFPVWMTQEGGFSMQEAGWAMGIYGVGIFLLGWFCAYWVQHYRRNHVFLLSGLLFVLTLFATHEVLFAVGKPVTLSVLMLLRLLTGMFFGLSKMVLGSTLLTDTSESSQRTEADYSSAWFGRFALSLGPLAGLLCFGHGGFSAVLQGAMGFGVAGVALVMLMKFPFRSPDETAHLFSSDRFFLTEGMPLFLNLTLSAVAIGLLLCLPPSLESCAMLMVGFLLAILSQQFVFPHADLRSEIPTGLLLMGTSLLLMLVREDEPVVAWAAPLLTGTGFGLVSSRFLLFFVKLSRHCRRGTSHSTYILSVELGLAVGLAAGYALLGCHRERLLMAALAVTVAAFLLYHLFTHGWYLRNKNR